MLVPASLGNGNRDIPAMSVAVLDCSVPQARAIPNALPWASAVTVTSGFPHASAQPCVRLCKLDAPAKEIPPIAPCPWTSTSRKIAIVAKDKDMVDKKELGTKSFISLRKEAMRQDSFVVATALSALSC